MKTRLVAALVGLAILVPALLFGGTIAVEIIVPIVLLVALDEYVRMAFPDDFAPALAWQVAMAVLAYGTLLYLGDRWFPTAAMLVFVATAIFVVLRPGPDLRLAADKVGRHLVGTAWLAVLLGFLPLLRRLDDGMLLVLVVLAISWLGDTGGYFAGRFLGKRKLYERISPKKTWAGYVGGLVGSVAGVFLFRAIGLPWLSPLDCVVMGVILGSAGVLGDLTESLFKRAHDVKDSGWIMPGHGGILDRIDSVLFVGPLVYAYVVLVKGI